MTIHEPISAPGCGCDRADVSKGLWPVDAALAQALKLIEPTGQTEVVTLSDASGRILAADLCAKEQSPRFDNSAVDGYAVATNRLKGSGPWKLAVNARIAAGDPIGLNSPKVEAAQIFTGAKVPEGFNAIIMQEDVTRFGTSVSFASRPEPGCNIRVAGEEYAAGARLLAAGTVLGPAEIGCAAAAGACRLVVRRKLRVSLVVSGTELTPPGEDLEGSGIWDANTSMLQSALCDPKIIEADAVRVTDSRAGLAEQLRRQAQMADVIVVSGGASVGEEDHLHAAIADAGGSVAVSGVAIKPGKPVAFGSIGQTLVLGLPGNPVSAYITWLVLGRPVLDHLAGMTKGVPKTRHVKAGHSLRHKPGRCEYRPARIVGHKGTGIEVIQADQATHSSRLSSLIKADGLVRLPAFSEQVNAGDLLEFLPF